MSLLSLIPKLVEKTQAGKITWTKAFNCEFRYISSTLDSNKISIEQIPTIGENTLDAFYYIKLFDVKDDIPVLELMEKIEIGKLSALLKEVRNQVLHTRYSEKIDGLKTFLDTL